MNNQPNLGEFGFIPERSHETPKNKIIDSPERKPNESGFVAKKQRKVKPKKPKKKVSEIVESPEETYQKERLDEYVPDDSKEDEGIQPKRKKHKILPYLLATIAALIVATVIYHFFFYKKVSAPNPEIVQQPNTNPSLAIPLEFNPINRTSNPFLKNQNGFNNFDLRYGIG